MTAEGHVIFALATAVIAKQYHFTEVLATADWWHIIPATLLTCLLPDLDHPHSFTGQRLPWIARPLSRLVGHRGLTHSLLIIIVLLYLCQLHPVGMRLPAPDIMQSLVLGYCSHIVADMLTPAGVPLLWPCRFRFRIPLLAGAGQRYLERVFCLVLLIGAVFLPVDNVKLALLSFHQQVVSSLVHWQKRVLSPLQ